MAGGGAKMKRLDFKARTPEESLQRAREFLKVMEKRRSVRQYSSRSIPEGVLETCIQTASQAPSGANKQPWTFALITNDKIKSQIREAAERRNELFMEGEPLGVGSMIWRRLVPTKKRSSWRSLQR